MPASNPSSENLFWLPFSGLTVPALLVLFMRLPDNSAGPVPGVIFGGFDTTFWKETCSTSPGWLPICYLALIWSLMTAAMMRPTVISAFAACGGLTSILPRALLRYGTFAGRTMNLARMDGAMVLNGDRQTARDG